MIKEAKDYFNQKKKDELRIKTCSSNYEYYPAFMPFLETNKEKWGEQCHHVQLLF